MLQNVWDLRPGLHAYALHLHAVHSIFERGRYESIVMYRAVGLKRDKPRKKQTLIPQCAFNMRECNLALLCTPI